MVETYNDPTEIAAALLELSEGDQIEATLRVNGDEKTTEQTVVDVVDKGAITRIHCESPFGSGDASLGFDVRTAGVKPELQNEVLTALKGGLTVEEFVQMEITEPREAEA
ncbi:hypothetical protein [Halostella litorea]|uniref:hypothetical protein n=1 Tax=Halostella litorea TaxID=2528831 RepID=UPI0010924613|nr:hypothetical protein [Halostella litorea]